MDKNILDQYMDACALIKETEADIQELKKRKRVVQDSVKGSNPEFPYQSQSFHIEGTTERTGDWSLLAAEQRILADRKANAAKIKTEVEAWMNTIPQRIQRIIRFKYFQNLSWEETATRMGRNATAGSVKMEYQRFFDKK